MYHVELHEIPHNLSQFFPKLIVPRCAIIWILGYCLEVTITSTHRDKGIDIVKHEWFLCYYHAGSAIRSVHSESDVPCTSFPGKAISDSYTITGRIAKNKVWKKG
jgi:hypothetical protein